MESFEHIEREFGIDSQQRVEAFLRMNLGVVAKDIPRRQWNQTPGARDAVEAEWRRLREHDVWDEKHPRGLRDVMNEAKNAGKTIHVGRLFDHCVEKHSELEEKKKT